MDDVRKSGLEAVGDLPWGTHFCQFYQTGEDLADTLVPFFKAGLAANEACLWVTSEPLRAREARAALGQAVPDLDQLLARGQIEIIDYQDWYLRYGQQDAASALRGWIEREERALAQGYAGLRLTGNTWWLEREGWESFMEYEEQVNRVFAPRRILALCSYCTKRCDAEGVVDVVTHHQFALVRRRGSWEILESGSMKQAKAEIQRMNAQLEQRVRERTAQLEAALQVRDEFLAVASHELVTPLSAIKLHVQGMLRAEKRGQIQGDDLLRRLERADQQVDRLEGLIDELLTVSRAGAGDPELELEPIDLVSVVEKVAAGFVGQMHEAGCEMSLSRCGDTVGRWDRGRLEKILSCLLSNAVKYGANKPVEIRVVAVSYTAFLEVRDAGLGISREDQVRIFERFERAVSRTNYGGLGLGLWIASRFARSLGGRIDVKSAPGAGATFTVLLPLTDQATA